MVVGAPLIAVFGARLPRRELLIGLMAVFLVGNAASALATDFTSLTLARFFAGSRTAPTSASPRWSPPTWSSRSDVAGRSAG